MSKFADLESVRQYALQVANRRGWVVNPDLKFTDVILAGLSSTAVRTGWPYCPCRDVEGEDGNNKDIICPCSYAAADIDEHGQCYCGLYLGKGKNSAEVASIPERRLN